MPTPSFSPSENGFMKIISENKQEIYRRTLILDADFNEVEKRLVFSCKFAAYFQNTFLQEHFRLTAVKLVKQLCLRKLIKKLKNNLFVS